MKSTSILILVFSVFLLTSCSDTKSKNTSTDNTTNTAAEVSKKSPKNNTKESSTNTPTNTVEISETKNATDNSSNSKSIVLVKSFVAARNSFDTDKLIALTNENYKESFKTEFVEIKSRQELLHNLVWAKEMNSTTTIKEIISESESEVVLIEESTNYIDVALKRKPRSFKTTYYLKNGIILRQNFDDAPGQVFDNKANDRLYGDFERFCKERKIQFSWNPTKEDGKILRKALEQYANRTE
ncbi:MAG: hypothetical protein AB8B65_17480 [Kordia sp.]|uniref:hypothetical protein n=1 Tax=Kordia sp. TaxID=1965332 RepID=UPI00385F0349